MTKKLFSLSILFSVLTCFAQQTAGKEWTISTEDTRLTIGITDKGQLSICNLRNPAAGWNWTAEPSVFPLMDKVTVDGKTAPVEWKYKDCIQDNSDGQKLTLRFVCGQPALFIKCDLTKLDDFTLNQLTNDEVIAIDQDPLGKQGIAATKDPNYQVMVKDLEDGSKAVGLFNLTENDLKITAPWNTLKLSGKQKVRDLWRQKDLGVFGDKFDSEVPPHGVALVKVSK